MKYFFMRLLFGSLAGLSLGLLTGAGELVYLTYTELKILMTPAQWTALFGMSLVSYGAVGGAVGAVVAGVLAPITGRGAKVQYYRSVMKRDMLAPTYAAVIGVTLVVMGWIVASPWLLAAFRASGGMLWAISVSGFIAVIGGLWGLALYRILRRRDEGQAAIPLWFPVPVLGLALFVAGLVRPPAGGKGFGTHVNEALPNLVLITLDTYRADHISWLGEVDVSTPTMDFFVRHNVYFPNAVAPMPETAPSHASMLTGLHPLDHRVLDNASEMPDDIDTLPEFLRDQGYSTAAFVSAYSLDRDLNLDQGFTVYDDDFSRGVRGKNDLALFRLAVALRFKLGKPATMEEIERTAPMTRERANEWLARHYSENFFLWVHFFEPHAPYIPHGLKGFEDNGTPDNPALDHVRTLDERRNSYLATEIEPLQRLYAEECSYTDRQVGELLKTLEDFRVFDNSVVVIVGDHGESLGEHDIYFSHMGLYDPSLRVPFMVRAPALGDKPKQVDDQVRVQDLMPTVLPLMGFRYAVVMDGRDLGPRIRGEESGDLQALLVGRMGTLGSGMHVGMRESSWKYLRTPPPEAEESFYMLEADPGETHDVAAENAQAVQAARVGVNAALGGSSEELMGDGGSISAEQRARLEMLGYVEEDAPEPK